ncbi:hypothetical protein MVEN_01579500 [Mycena venus]|uniref:Zn(2)-C6 fungal-type domain-containing protein n=1 Tax=Mycena venus TaxID=2733690 RepID=A0A8H6XSN9_9AGAR|nr:hypothetical protein MVEN_01579500 [Mycena venus]
MPRGRQMAGSHPARGRRHRASSSAFRLWNVQLCTALPVTSHVPSFHYDCHGWDACRPLRPAVSLQTRDHVRHNTHMPQSAKKDISAQRQLEKESKRARGALSCAECRRLKLKCDKTVPCSSCKRRGCSAICPNGSLITGQGTRFVLADTEKLHHKVAAMSDRILHLEDALAVIQSTVTTEPHPLLTRELLKIKSSIELHSANEGEDEKALSDSEYIDAFGTLAIREDGAATFYGRRSTQSEIAAMSDRIRHLEDALTAAMLQSTVTNEPRPLLKIKSNIQIHPAMLIDRIRHLEDALAMLQSTVTDEQHPLLTRELLRIKSRVQLSSAAEGEDEQPLDEYTDAFGKLAVPDDGAATFHDRSVDPESESLLVGNVLRRSRAPSPHSDPQGMASIAAALGPSVLWRQEGPGTMGGGTPFLVVT